MKPYRLRKQVDLSIVEKVCDLYETEIEEFEKYSTSRHQKWVEIRQVIMYLLSKDGVITADISEYLNMDHSAILHGIRKIENYIKIYPEYSFIKQICIAG